MKVWMKYTVKKFISLVISLLFTSIVTFTAFQVIPGDSALSALGMDATEKQLEEYREEMGLKAFLWNRCLTFPVWVDYWCHLLQTGIML